MRMIKKPKTRRDVGTHRRHSGDRRDGVDRVLPRGSAPEDVGSAQCVSHDLGDLARSFRCKRDEQTTNSLRINFG